MVEQVERDVDHAESIDQAESEAKISYTQYILAGLSVVLGLLPILFHKTEDIPFDLFACTIGLAGMFVVLWIEHAKVRRLVDTLNMRSATSEQKLIQHFARHCTSLMNKFGSRTEDILKLLQLNHDLLDCADDYLKPLRKLLTPNNRGMERVQKNLIVRLAEGQLAHFHLNLDRPDSESYRMLELGDAIQYADKYVYACTYCDPSYLNHFWYEPGDNSLDEYYRAHAHATAKGSKRVQRVFVMTAEANADSKARAIYGRVIKKLSESGVNCLYEISEDRAKSILGTTTSFLVVDDEFVSESYGVEHAEGTGSSSKWAGWIAFDYNKAKRLKDIFEKLRGKAERIVVADIRGLQAENDLARFVEDTKGAEAIKPVRYSSFSKVENDKPL